MILAKGYTEKLMEQNRKLLLVIILSAFPSISFLLRHESLLCKFILKEILVSVLVLFFYFFLYQSRNFEFPALRSFASDLEICLKIKLGVPALQWYQDIPDPVLSCLIVGDINVRTQLLLKPSSQISVEQLFFPPRSILTRLHASPSSYLWALSSNSPFCNFSPTTFLKLDSQLLLLASSNWANQARGFSSIHCHPQTPFLLSIDLCEVFGTKGVSSNCELESHLGRGPLDYH